MLRKSEVIQPMETQGELEKKKGSCVHQSTCAGAALSTNGVVADVV